LILDGGGSPTTITVLSSEALYVTYQLNQFVPLTDVTGSITLNGVNYSYTLRAANATTASWWAPQNGDLGGLFVSTGGTVNLWNGSIGVITGSPTGANAGDSSITNNSYSMGSYTMSGTANWGLTSGNLSGGATAVSFAWGSNGSRGIYQLGFGAAVPKTSSFTLALSFSMTWARV
jgi:hypothetical protein